MKGKLHPSINRSKDGLRYIVPTFLLMNNGSILEPLFYSGLGSLVRVPCSFAALSVGAVVIERRESAMDR